MFPTLGSLGWAILGLMAPCAPTGVLTTTFWSQLGVLWEEGQVGLRPRGLASGIGGGGWGQGRAKPRATSGLDDFLSWLLRILAKRPGV